MISRCGHDKTPRVGGVEEKSAIPCLERMWWVTCGVLTQISVKLVRESSVANKRKQLQETFDDYNMDGETKKSSSRYPKQIHTHTCVYLCT